MYKIVGGGAGWVQKSFTRTDPVIISVPFLVDTFLTKQLVNFFYS